MHTPVRVPLDIRRRRKNPWSQNYKHYEHRGVLGTRHGCAGRAADTLSPWAILMAHFLLIFETEYCRVSQAGLKLTMWPCQDSFGLWSSCPGLCSTEIFDMRRHNFPSNFLFTGIEVFFQLEWVLRIFKIESMCLSFLLEWGFLCYLNMLFTIHQQVA